MSGYFDAAYFDPAYFDTGVAEAVSGGMPILVQPGPAFPPFPARRPMLAMTTLEMLKRKEADEEDAVLALLFAGV